VRARMVREAERYAWSSARGHALGEPDPILSDGRPWPGPVADWSAWRAEPEAVEETDRLRERTHTGRPCGSGRFVAMLGWILGRVLHPDKPGRPTKRRSDEEEAQLDMLTTGGRG
jgi:hypothetical protein